MNRLHFITSAALVGSTACQAQIPAPRAPWVVIFEGGQALASVDTSRLSVRGGVADVWLRFDYAEAAADSLPGSKPFTRVDAHQRITCAAERVDDLAMETRDAAGRIVDRGPGTRWHTFREHPFGQYVLPALCKRLPELVR
ncbi:MAG TPA: hypothetical protein VF584_17635 [Longimicrobium sp.]|jgi:hypothetical protein